MLESCKAAGTRAVPCGLQPHLSPQRQKCAAQSWPSTADNSETFEGMSSQSQNYAWSSLLQDLKTFFWTKPGISVPTAHLFREKACIWFLCGYNLFSRAANIGLNLSTSHLCQYSSTTVKSLFFCYIFLCNKNKQLKRDKIVISRIAFAVSIYNHIQNPAEYWTPYTEVSKMEQGEEEKK